MRPVTVDYTRSSATGASCTAQAWARVPEPLDPAQRRDTKARARALLDRHNAVLVAHYYVDGDLQDLALETGGIVSDSLEMARFGRDHPARTLVVAGVRFMGETAKILSPGKRVLMPDLEATCSLDLGCPPDEFARFCDAHPDRTVVVYANTSAAVKARAHWMVTSSCALAIVDHLKTQDKKILWAPDRHLGRYIEQRTGADMLMWNGECIVHDEFKGLELKLMKEQHPGAKVLVHPESPEAVIRLADVVGSTSQLLNAVVKMDAPTFIIATDKGILHRMRQLAPGKILLEAPTAGESATCKSCAHCPWMAMNAVQGVVQCLENALGPAASRQVRGAQETLGAARRFLESGRGEVFVDEPVRSRALGCIERMLDFVARNPVAAQQPAHGMVAGIGAA